MKFFFVDFGERCWCCFVCVVYKDVDLVELVECVFDEVFVGVFVCDVIGYVDYVFCC